MAKRVSVDKLLFAATLLLVFIGIVMVFSASAVMAKERYGSPYTFFLRQVVWAAAGVLGLLATMRVDYRRYKHPAVVFSALAATMLLLVAVFFLDRSHNTHRWIKWGAFSVQPSELAKPALILFLAWFLDLRAKAMDDVRGTLLPAVVPALLVAALIVKQPDLGTAMACMALTGGILFVAGVELRTSLISRWRRAGALLADLPRGVALPAHPRVPGPLLRPARARLPHHSVADCGGDRRHHRPGTDGREAEAVLPPGAAHRFHLRRDRGRVGADRRVVLVALFAVFLIRGLRAAVRTPDPSAGTWRSGSPAWW